MPYRAFLISIVAAYLKATLPFRDGMAPPRKDAGAGGAQARVDDQVLLVGFS